MKRIWILALAACAEPITEPEPDAGVTPTFEAACAPRACETAATVDIDALLAVAEWPTYDDYTSGCLAASSNLPLQGSITLNATNVDAQFRIDTPIAGVQCIGPTEYFDFTACDEVRITDATIRIRTVTQDIHPAPGNFIRIVDVLPPCDAACAPAELRCEATSTCWQRADSYCRFCLGGTPEQCACWGGEDFKADGEFCEFAISGDVYRGGTCDAGTCQPF